jgi:hypothetical protein
MKDLAPRTVERISGSCENTKIQAGHAILDCFMGTVALVTLVVTRRS